MDPRPSLVRACSLSLYWENGCRCDRSAIVLSGEYWKVTLVKEDCGFGDVSLLPASLYAAEIPVIVYPLSMPLGFIGRVQDTETLLGETATTEKLTGASGTKKQKNQAIR